MGNALFLIVFILSVFLAVWIVNFFQKLIMKITGSSVMFYSLKSKLIWYGIVWGMLAMIIFK